MQHKKFLTRIAILSALTLSPGFTAAAMVGGDGGETSYLKQLNKDIYIQPMVDEEWFDKLDRDSQDKILIARLKENKEWPLNRRLAVFGSIVGATALTMVVAYLVQNQLDKKNVEILNRVHARNSGGNQRRENGFVAFFENAWAGFNAMIGADSNTQDTFKRRTGVFGVLAGENKVDYEAWAKNTKYSGFLGLAKYAGWSLFYTAPKLFSALGKKYWDREEDPMRDADELYVVKRRYLTKELQEKAENLLITARADVHKVSQAKDVISYISAIPLHALPINFSVKRFDKAFAGYPEETKKEIMYFCLRQMMMADPMPADGSQTPIRLGKRMAAFFYGAPGAGKTRFAEEVAKTLNLPFARIALEGLTKEDLLGTPLDSGNPKPGILLDAIRRATEQYGDNGAKNMILFIDEADRVINGQDRGAAEVVPLLLKLLDPEAKTFPNAYLGNEIDISHLIIILAGNYQIKDEALRKRFLCIPFTGFTLEYKKQIIWTSNLNKMLDSYNKNGKFKIVKSDFTEEDKNYIERLIELDKDYGFRTIENLLLQYIDYKVMLKYFNKNEQRPDFMKKLDKMNQEFMRGDFVGTPPSGTMIMAAPSA